VVEPVRRPPVTAPEPRLAVSEVVPEEASQVAAVEEPVEASREEEVAAAAEAARIVLEEGSETAEVEEPVQADQEKQEEQQAAREPERASVARDLSHDVESDIKAAAAEAAAVEELAETPLSAEEPMLLDEMAGRAAEARAARAAPHTVAVEDEMPFELVIEPRALVPGQIEFVRASDEVLFNRAIDFLGSRDIRGMREGIEMLGRIAGETAANVLKNLYSIAPPRWRPDVAHQLVNHDGSGIKQFFCGVLDGHDEPPVVRIAALRGLFARDRALATEYLLTALSDESDEVRAAAATYLGWLREKRAMPMLEKLVGDKSQAVAKAALHAASSIRL
jgi:hypothetical protein